MEKNTISATPYMLRTTTPKSLRNFTERRRYNLRSKQKFCFDICELRDVFLRRLEPNISQALGRAVLKNMEVTTQDFFVWAEKNEPEQNLPKKYAQSTRCKLFFHHRSCRSEASRRKRENSKI